jgi:hypothetical protein
LNAPLCERVRLGLSRNDHPSAGMLDRPSGLRILLESARSRVYHLRHLWLDAGYEGRGKRWSRRPWV